MLCFLHRKGKLPVNKLSSFLSKTEILNAAEQTLRKYGPDKASVTDVAKLLGVSHGTLYRHFPSKAALREAVTERWLEEMIVAPLTEIAAIPTTNALGQLRDYIAKLVELKQHHASQDSEMFKMYAAVTEESAALVEVHIRKLLDHIDLLIAQGMEQGLISRSIPAAVQARSVLYGTARFHHPAHAYEWRSPGIMQEFAQLWTLLERGLSEH
ncbi:TetR family transcriptional regulator [Paenibacillus sp. LMG 31459]|uniref:TetR family transcriptional regulator n=1 Tax=Paenibacillus phytohabitans TaxID=2654978 RepID=A0ABX1YSP2_9BACL|nr:TetR family transcriptional regulator [Paenibacillus phytohabitans]NOU83594.1 TetR family transcriptional regulator [Paenibacillus phytohabitans]